MKKTDCKDLTLKPISQWLNEWLVLTAGNETEFNSMTVAWGSIGGIWHKPFVQVFVRPTRYTFEFIEKYPTFTLCGFPAKYKKALTLIGTKSGRECDKIAESGLTPVKSELAEAPSFKEASLVIECRKIYYQDMDPENFIDKSLEANYPLKDYHRMYYGEILNILSL